MASYVNHHLPKLSEKSRLTIDKKNKAEKKTMKKQTEDEALFDKLEGPYVHIKGDFNSPVEVRVINSALSSRDSSTKPSKSRVMCDQDLGTKVGNFGYPTVSSRQYDHKNLNGSWVCVFCNQTTHWEGLGDLFGPYWVSSSRMKTPKRNLYAEVASEHVNGDDEGEDSEKATDISEIWFHEDCLCWVPCVYVVGSKLVGLEEAVEQTNQTVCCRCDARGASVGCCSPGCRQAAHLGCAARDGWALDINTFIATCSRHKLQIGVDQLRCVRTEELLAV